MKKKIFIPIFILALIFLYSFRVYSINKNAPNLRDFKEEQINETFNAFDGNIKVKSIRLINEEELKGKKNLSEYDKSNIDTNNNEYLDIVYILDNVENEENLDIKANVDGYIFYDGLPSPIKIGDNEYEYLIPIPKEKLHDKKIKTIKIFFDNLKSNELEHHYIKFDL